MRLSTHGDEAGLPYTPPDRLIADFVSRGMVLLSPDDVGVAPEVHQRIYEAEKAAMAQRQSLKPADVPEMLEVLDAPGLVAACDRLVGPNWAIVPSMHCSSFVRGGRNQHWHKDDNGPYNSRKQRHHQAVQLELLYYPQPVGAMMGPTATIPYSQYWALNHEENHDNFAGADHLDFEYHIGGMEREDISGPDSPYSREQIAEAQTPHDLRTREAVKNTGWPLVTEFEAAPLRAGSVIIYSHNLYHRGNHRRDDWHTWEDNPRFMWRFWLYRTTDPPTVTATVVANGWSRDADPLTGTDLSVAGTNVIAVWDYHYHWIQPGRRPAACRLAAADEDGCSDADARADRLLQQLHTTGEAAEPQRVGAAYRLAAMDGPMGLDRLGRALHTERESVRRAATYGLVAAGAAATPILVEATHSPVKWIRKAGAYGLGDASVLTAEVLETLEARLVEDPSVYVRSVAAGSLGCLGRRAIASGGGCDLVPACAAILVACLDREENRPAMDQAQGRSIKFVRPTDECDVCEGNGWTFGHDRFALVRSAVRENALWSLVMLCSHGAQVLGGELERTIAALERVIRADENAICVGFAMDALSRLAHLHPDAEAVPPHVARLRASLRETLDASPVWSWESLVRTGLAREA